MNKLLRDYKCFDTFDKVVKPVAELDFSQWWVSTGYKEGERNSFENECTDRHILMAPTGLLDMTGKAINEFHVLEKMNCDKQWIVVWLQGNCRFSLHEVNRDGQNFNYGPSIDIQSDNNVMTEFKIAGTIFDEFIEADNLEKCIQDLIYLDRKDLRNKLYDKIISSENNWEDLNRKEGIHYITCPEWDGFHFMNKFGFYCILLKDKQIIVKPAEIWNQWKEGVWMEVEPTKEILKLLTDAGMI